MEPAATAPQGLSTAEVAERAARGLRNVAPRESTRTVPAILRGNFATVFNLVVFTMAAVLFVLYLRADDLRPLYDAVAISGLALLNSVVGVVQEVRAKRALDRISALARSTCTVLRDGKLGQVAQDQLVQGDLIQVSRGDPIPVDGTIVATAAGHCEVDESLLTGESESVEKPVGAPVRSGSFCVAGQGLLVAEQVGAASYLHGVVREVKAYRPFKTPLQKNVDRIVQLLTSIAGVLVVLVVAQAVARVRPWPVEPGERLEEVIEVARSVAAIVTSMVPMGLVLLSTVAFSLGVLRISRKGALVQRLNAVESFSHVDVLCMDKTGTLTKNELRLCAATPAAGGSEAALRAAAGVFAHRCTEQNGTVLALRLATATPGAGVEVLGEVPFNSRDKWSGLDVRDQAGGQRGLVLGALEVLGARLPEAQREEARRVTLAAPGLRHVLLAETESGATVAARGGLRLLGVLSLSDEVRADAPEVLRAFAARGLSLKILSGDAAETVRAVAREAGWPAGAGTVVTGPELDAMTPEELSAAAGAQSLFARVSPQNKRALVRALQAQGRYVAMIGDGVNDVLALKEANLGIAMGAGSRMARDVSDLVLLGNDFALLPEVLSEGSSIVANVETAAKLFLTKNAFSLTLVLATGFLGLAFPFVPRHVSVLNLFAITLPAMFITFSRRPPDAEPPLGGTKPSFLREVLRFAGRSGGLIGLGALGSFFVSLVALDAPVERARTVLLTQLVLLCSLNFLLVVGGAHLVSNLRRSLLLALFPLAFSALYLGLLFGLTQTGSLSWAAGFLEVERLTGVELAVTLGTTLVAGAAMVWAQLRALRAAALRLAPPP
jgi:cation-transporting ATPase E